LNSYPQKLGLFLLAFHLSGGSTGRRIVVDFGVAMYYGS